ncbi:hypothetical protein C8Q77DRAFT_1226930 [Trametes polyzona]|nr:hypothetical protein C8Q77DRAFT_1226930 [Trametes polyzona]
MDAEPRHPLQKAKDLAPPSLSTVLLRAHGPGTYSRREVWMRGVLRSWIRQALVLLTGDKDMFMRWTVEGYFNKIYVEYGLELVGWPEDIPFADLSKCGMTGLGRISRLFVLWQVEELRFIHARLDRTAREAQKPLDVVPNRRHNGGLRVSLGRSDMKKPRGRMGVDPERYPPRHARNGPKSAKWVTAEAEARAERASRVAAGEDPDDPIEQFTDDE